jgi:NADH:ubiquinone oxidoreductase subunit 6 (subunit J)
MRVFSRRLSDDELVLKVCKSLLWHRRFRPYLAILILLCLVGHVTLTTLILSMLLDLAGQANQQRPTIAGFSLGLTIGIGLGITLVGSMHQLVLAIREPRITRLLVQHYRPDA